MAGSTNGGNLIAAERRRRIYELVQRNGSANVADLASALGVADTTIRADLRALHREGKVIRSHGGALLRDSATPRPPYSQTRAANIEQKSLIGKAALQFLPESGSFFIGSGSTVQEFALFLPKGRQFKVVTNALEIATHLAANDLAMVEMIGGCVRPDTLETDVPRPDQSLDDLFWEAAFIGAAAIDVARGITALDRAEARWERSVIERSSRTVVLCDSSKVGKFSFVKVAPVETIDVLITDSGADPGVVEAIREQGVQVVVAGSNQNDQSSKQ